MLGSERIYRRPEGIPDEMGAAGDTQQYKDDTGQYMGLQG